MGKQNLLIIIIPIVAAVLGAIFRDIIFGAFRIIQALFYWISSLLNIRFFLLRKYKDFIIKNFQTTKIGYLQQKIDIHKNYINLKVIENIPKADQLLTYNRVYTDRKSTRLNSSHTDISRMPSSA